MPETIIIDYKIGVILTIRKLFCDLQHNGNRFHCSQCIAEVVFSPSVRRNLSVVTISVALYARFVIIW